AAALLGRRDELRGLLDAYRAKAARLGAAEDTELAARYRQASDLLWTAPCDLAAATAAVTHYQQAILALSERRQPRCPWPRPSARSRAAAARSRTGTAPCAGWPRHRPPRPRPRPSRPPPRPRRPPAPSRAAAARSRTGTAPCAGWPRRRRPCRSR